MSWEFQIKILATGEWRSVHPNGQPPYRYPTRGQARYMMRVCYPDQVRDVRLGGEPMVRIIESAEPANMEYPCPPAFDEGEDDY